MRIVAISDLHGQFPFKRVPPDTDLLIVAGDLCPDIFPNGRKRPTHAFKEPARQKQWFEEAFIPWATTCGAHDVAITWGNHDFCGRLYPRGAYLHPSGVHILTDARVTFHGLQFWFTPWSNQFMDWAWMKPHDELAEIYAAIPSDTDVLVSHQPPYGCGDLYPDMESGKLRHIGSSELLYHIERVRPKKVVCGHLHSGHGRYRVADGATEVLNVAVLDETYTLSYQKTVFEVTADAESPLSSGQACGVGG